MATRIYNYQGINRTEERRIKQIERSKLVELLERERKLTNYLAGHYADLIVKDPKKFADEVEWMLLDIENRPEIVKINERVNAILEDYPDFMNLAGRLQNRTDIEAFERLDAAVCYASQSC